MLEPWNFFRLLGNEEETNSGVQGDCLVVVVDPVIDAAVAEDAARPMAGI